MDRAFVHEPLLLLSLDFNVVASVVAPVAPLWSSDRQDKVYNRIVELDCIMNFALAQSDYSVGLLRERRKQELQRLSWHDGRNGRLLLSTKQSRQVGFSPVRLPV